MWIRGEGGRANIGLALLTIGVTLTAAIFTLTQSYISILRVETAAHTTDDNSTAPADRSLTQIWTELENVRKGLSQVYYLLMAGIGTSAVLAYFSHVLPLLDKRSEQLLVLSSLTPFIAALWCGYQLSLGQSPDFFVAIGFGLVLALLMTAAVSRHRFAERLQQERLRKGRHPMIVDDLSDDGPLPDTRQLKQSFDKDPRP